MWGFAAVVVVVVVGFVPDWAWASRGAGEAEKRRLAVIECCVVSAANCCLWRICLVIIFADLLSSSCAAAELEYRVRSCKNWCCPNWGC